MDIGRDFVRSTIYCLPVADDVAAVNWPVSVVGFVDGVAAYFGSAVDTVDSFGFVADFADVKEKKNVKHVSMRDVFISVGTLSSSFNRSYLLLL